MIIRQTGRDNWTPTPSLTDARRVFIHGKVLPMAKEPWRVRWTALSRFAPSLKSWPSRFRSLTRKGAA